MHCWEHPEKAPKNSNSVPVDHLGKIKLEETIDIKPNVECGVIENVVKYELDLPEPSSNGNLQPISVIDCSFTIDHPFNEETNHVQNVEQEHPNTSSYQLVFYDKMKTEATKLSTETNLDKQQQGLSQNRPTAAITKAFRPIYHCDDCDKKFGTKSSYSNHVRIHYGTKNTEKLETHENAPCKIICKFCGLQFEDMKGFINHSTQGNSCHYLVCKECGVTFKTSTSLKRHMNCHKPARHYCCFCIKAFSRQDGYKIHLLKHIKELEHECKICGKQFAQNFSLSEHLKLHIDKPPLKCDFCTKSFHRQFNYSRHLKTHARKLQLGKSNT